MTLCQDNQTKQVSCMQCLWQMPPATLLYRMSTPHKVLAPWRMLQTYLTHALARGHNPNQTQS
jgi:hypothetical protein